MFNSRWGRSRQLHQSGQHLPKRYACESFLLSDVTIVQTPRMHLNPRKARPVRPRPVIRLVQISLQQPIHILSYPLSLIPSPTYYTLVAQIQLTAPPFS